MKNINNKFCAAPFTSLYEGQFGRISACCAMATELGNSNHSDLKEIFNNEKFTAIRKSFLENKFPKECKSCKQFEEQNNVIANVRESASDFAGDKLKTALKYTNPDGTLSKQIPVFLDLLWSNKCNFACMGCNGELSSTIATKYSEAYSIANQSKINTKLWENNNQKKIDYILEHKDSINLIHLNGGEPFMQKEIYEFLEVLLENNLHKTIKIWSHTNGSITRYQKKDIIDDYLCHWGENCTITVSHDGHGTKGEYTRYGLKQDKWIKNVQRMIDKNIHVNLQTCYNMFNALEISELYNWYNNHTDIDPCDRSITVWHSPFIFSPKMLHLDKNLLAKANSELDNLEQIENINWNIEELRLILNTPPNQKHLIKQKELFRKSIEKFDELRKTNFQKTFPELKSII